MTRALQAAWLAACLLLAIFAPIAAAQDVQPVPALTARVVDKAGVLDAAQREQLEAQLAGVEASLGTQIVVLTVATTQPEDIAAFAQRVADSWKIGRRNVGDGLLVVIARDDRKLRIEVAKALEGAVPDLAAKQILDNTLRPALRAGDYAGGLAKTVEQLAARIRGEGLPVPDTERRGGSDRSTGIGAQFEDLGLFLFIAVPMAAMFITRLFGRKLGSLLTAGAAGGAAWWFSHSLALAIGAGLVTLFIVGLLGIGSALSRLASRSSRGGGWTSGPSWGGGGGWSSGGGSGDGGGFSSGGGGDFGGGGASGDW